MELFDTECTRGEATDADAEALRARRSRGDSMRRLTVLECSARHSPRLGSVPQRLIRPVMSGPIITDTIGDKSCITPCGRSCLLL